MGFSTAVRADIANGVKTFDSRMEAKSLHLHGKRRQNVQVDSSLVEKRRRRELAMDVIALVGEDPLDR